MKYKTILVCKTNIDKYIYIYTKTKLYNFMKKKYKADKNIYENINISNIGRHRRLRCRRLRCRRLRRLRCLR